MNLGDANLRVVNTSRPALVHSTSKQSVSASDDFYSLSSGESSQDEKTTIRQYETPPLYAIPVPHQRKDGSDVKQPTVRAITRTPPAAPQPGPSHGSQQLHKIKRKPLSTESSPTYSTNEVISPPTPGVDDTPYIQFAIEQLTRDEEVNEALSSHPYGATSRVSHPLDRLFPDEQFRLQQGLQAGDRGKRPLEPIRGYSDSSIIKLRRDPSGLRWDPRSLADILVLFQRSNVLSDLYGSEVTAGSSGPILAKKYTLRYWIAGKRSTEIFHGVEESQAPLHGFQQTQSEKRPSGSEIQEAPDDLESQQPLKASTLDSLQKDVHSPRIRYRWLPWFLKDTFVVAWIVIAVILMLAFVIVSFVNNAVQRGFLPLLPSETTPQGFSPADFLYSFIPSMIGMILFLLWQSIDMYFRALEPFARLSGSTRGSPADESILLDYTACLPVEVTVKAGVAGHYKVAWISFISLLSATLPVLSGGVFTAQYFIPSREVRVAASLPGYYALVVFIIMYSLSFVMIWPRKKRRLPHDIRTLGQMLSFVYESQLLDDSAFWQPRSKVDLVTRLLGRLTGDKGSSRYAFGVYLGRDGREHLGIDRLHRPGSGEMLITTGLMG
ncbi:MAG: hypothetical protein LQ345_004954 [Seirophora villosa]|nr:MAG: hypothetical protein LQ345_004954 [Seirophora villosa]